MYTQEKIIRVISTIAIVCCMVLFRRFGAIFEVVMLVIGAYAIAPIIALRFGSTASTLFNGTKRTETIPTLSHVKSLMNQRNYTDALEELRELQHEFPDHFPLYPLLFDIVLQKFDNHNEAREIYKIGWNAMSGEQRKRLEHLFNEYRND